MKYEWFIKKIVIVLLSLLLATPLYAQPKYRITPSDYEGPFYPVENRSDEDNDLVNVQGKSESAKGDVLELTGVVSDINGNLQSGVIIEIWQTDVNGLYRHPRDRSAGQRDPFFQYWGRAKTDKQGVYNFLTIIPGEYEPRPPHIHFKVWVDEKVVLTSQMYIVKGSENSWNVDELQKLKLRKNPKGGYLGFFRIVY